MDTPTHASMPAPQHHEAGPNKATIAAPDAARAILEYWFSLDPSAWFRSDPKIDAILPTRFEATVQAALAGELQAWSQTPEGTLALILVLDQFPRNLYRGTAAAFSGDAQAQALTTRGVAQGDDRALTPVQRLFFALPWEHAEELDQQERMVRYLTDLEQQVSERERPAMALYRDYAERHRAVIVKYGRFPHRNQALGRKSTAAERDYLARPGSGF